MLMRRMLWVVTGLVVGGCCLAAAAAAQERVDMRALVEQALDEIGPPIVLENVALGEAIARIANATGVELVMTPQAMEVLPYGAQTGISARIENVPLREGLQSIFDALGMVLHPSEGYIDVEPHPALVRLGRRATWQELDRLRQIRNWQPGKAPADRELLLEALQLAAVGDEAQREALRNKLAAMRSAVSGDAALDAATEPVGLTWTLDGAAVVIEPVEQAYARQLHRPISLSLTGRPIGSVLHAVGKALYVDVRVEPGAINQLPAHLRQHFSLTAQEHPGARVLETIADATGWGYVVDQQGVLFYQSDLPAVQAVAAPVESEAPVRSFASDPYVAQLVRPLPDGTEVRWLIRRSELPDDLLQVRQADIQRVIDTLRAERDSAGG